MEIIKKAGTFYRIRTFIFFCQIAKLFGDSLDKIDW